jgi:Tfp pilus assembly protein PilN
VRAVNLLPPDQRSRGLRLRPTPRAVAAAVVAAAAAAVGYWGFSLHQAQADARSDLDAARAETAELQAQVGAYSAAQSRRAAYERRRGLVIGLTAARVNWERIVRDTATVMPRQTWLTSLKAESPGLSTPGATPPAGGSGGSPSTPAAVPPAGGAGGPGLHLTGFAYTHKQVALLMARLGAVSGLGEPRLASSTLQPRGGRRVVQFQIDVPVDQRAQDRPTLIRAAGSSASTPTSVQP